ncbi:MAG TPA: type I methionyl aminopeptidase [Polyangiaceae bacterium LLY-WYZ-14_1]|nr:type I methionyl aminopeptidase [Polyangiaceae bacterium LLY-WYZ-14_1]
MASIELMTPSMLDRMRRSCRLAAECLTMVGDHIRPGITTQDIDVLVHDWITERDGYPSPLNYKGFPKSVCTSLNEVVCHGIPDPKQRLKDGDIINVDVTIYFPKKHGYHGDTSATFYVGQPSDDAIRVTEVSRACLELGIAEVRHGARIGDIGAAIQEHAERKGCSVVKDYVGHGVGREFHMPPQIPHYGERGKGKRLKAGMVFTIEPMINLGAPGTELQKDQWTVLTVDRALSAQFEHTIHVTREGAEVLTARPRLLKNSEDLPWATVHRRSSPAGWEARQVDLGETAPSQQVAGE